MGNLYDYFSAPDDGAALAAYDDGPVEVGFPTLETKGIDPSVQLGTLTAALAGQLYDDVVKRPRHCRLLSDPEADSLWLVTVTDELRDSVADASPEELAAVAGPWSQTEEFHGGQGDAESLARWLLDFAALAQQARAQGHRLFCLVSL